MELDKNKLLTRFSSIGLSVALTAGVMFPGEVAAQKNNDSPPPQKPPELLLPPNKYVQTLTVGNSRIIFDQATKARFTDQCDKDLAQLLVHPRVGEVFSGVHGLSFDEVAESLQLYYRSYCFAEIISGVRREDIAVGHGYETRFSADPEPWRGGYVGAMQRDRDLHPDSEVEELSELLGFLDNPNHRYRSPIYTGASTDYKEILWSGTHIANRARSFYPSMQFNEAVRKVIAENYSANGGPRLERADLMRSLR